MRYIGTFVRGDSHYYFIYSYSTTKTSWVLFNNSIKTGLSTKILTLDKVIREPQKIEKEFIEGAIVLSTKNLLAYGNTFLINNLIEIFNKKDTLQNKDVLSYEEFDNKIIKIAEKKSPMITVKKKETLFKTKILKKLENEDITVVKEVIEELNVKFGNTVLILEYNNIEKGSFVPKVEFNDVEDEFSDNGVEYSKDLISSTKAKSLSYLRYTRDLSFYYGPDGTTKKHYRLINSSKELQRILETEVKDKVKLWAVDIESTGLMMYKPNEINKGQLDRTVSIMVSWKKDEALFIPIDMVYVKNIDKDWVNIMKPYLESIPAVGANISFDARGLWSEYNIELNIEHDVLQLAFVINCFAVKNHNNLKEHEHKFLNVDTLTLKDIFGTSKLAGLFRYLPEELALIYACPDVDMCLELFYILIERLPPSCYKSYKLDMDTIKNLYKLDAIGNAVDVELAEKYRDANNKDRDIIKNLIYHIVGQQLALVNKVSELKSKYDFNNEEQLKKIEEELEQFLISPNYTKASKEFNLGSDDLGKYMFDLLKYPVYAVQEKTHKPAVNTTVLKKLMEQTFNSEEEQEQASILRSKGSSGYLKEDIVSAISDVIGSEEVLIKADTFNKMKYPLAYLITEYRLREKRDNTFFHQICDLNLGGLYYTSTKSAHAETARLINVIQVLQSYMKKLIVPYNKDYYHLIFDFSQIEYRVMTGVSGLIALKKALDNPRADFHKECGALLKSKKAHQVTHDERKQLKGLNFGIPYGLGLRSLCVSLYGSVTEENIFKTQDILNKWKTSFAKIWDMLESGRKKALDKGYAESITKRRRPFIKDYPFNNEEEEKSLVEEWYTNLTASQKALIRRESGNYLIQETAAHIFKIAFNNFRKRLKEEGLEDKVLTTALIHDEMVSSVHKSVNPYYLYRIIYEECMMIIKGHPRYYAGISIVDNWYEGKADEYEAPIEFVEYILKSDKSKNKYVDNSDMISPKELVFKDIKNFMQQLLKSEYEKLGIDFNSDTLDINTILENTEDYFILDKISVYWPIEKKFKKIQNDKEKTYNNTKFIRSFERFALELNIKNEYSIIYPKDYPLGIYGKITKEKRVLYNEDNIITLIQNTTDIKQEGNLITDLNLNLDTEMNFDLDLNLNENVLFEDINASLSELSLYDSFSYEGSAVYYFNDINKMEINDIEINRDKYINTNFNNTDKTIQFLKDEIIINNNDIKVNGLEAIKEYLIKYKSNKLGSLPVYIRNGDKVETLGFNVKGYNPDEILQIVKKYSL